MITHSNLNKNKYTLYVYNTEFDDTEFMKIHNNDGA